MAERHETRESAIRSIALHTKNASINLKDGDSTTGRIAFATGEHEIMIAIMGGFSVGSEIVLATVDRDEPGVSVVTEPGLRITRHGRKPSSVTAR